MTTWSSILAWIIPWKEETGGLQSMGLQRVIHNLAIGCIFSTGEQSIFTERLHSLFLVGVVS